MHCTKQDIGHYWTWGDIFRKYLKLHCFTEYSYVSYVLCREHDGDIVEKRLSFNPNISISSYISNPIHCSSLTNFVLHTELLFSLYVKTCSTKSEHKETQLYLSDYSFEYFRDCRAHFWMLYDHSAYLECTRHNSADYTPTSKLVCI